jgi:GNAT superfamily N-acetyltransferase
MDDRIALRPAGEDDLVVVESLTGDRDTAGVFAWFGWADPGRWRRSWAENGLLSAPAAYCWEIGIALLPEARGQGYGTQAHRLLARYLFAHTTVHRIEAATEVGNLAEQRALEKAGFTREGVLRGFGWRDGAWRDGVTYSLLRTDPVG